MATDKPRITITLEPDQHEVLRRLAGLQGGSMSRIVSELLAEITPVLERVCESLELAKRAQAGVRANLRRVAEEAEEDLRPLAEMARNQFDLFAGELQRLVEAGEGRQQEAPDAGDRPSDRRRRADGGADAEGAEAQSPRPVITGATGAQRSTRAGRGEGSGAVPKPSSGKGSSRATGAKVLADADNDGKGARVLGGGASRRAK